MRTSSYSPVVFAVSWTMLCLRFPSILCQFGMFVQCGRVVVPSPYMYELRRRTLPKDVRSAASLDGLEGSSDEPAVLIVLNVVLLLRSHVCDWNCVNAGLSVTVKNMVTIPEERSGCDVVVRARRLGRRIRRACCASLVFIDHLFASEKRRGAPSTAYIQQRGSRKRGSGPQQPGWSSPSHRRIIEFQAGLGRLWS